MLLLAVCCELSVGSFLMRAVCCWLFVVVCCLLALLCGFLLVYGLYELFSFLLFVWCLLFGVCCCV